MKRFLKNLFLKNWGLKLFSLFLAMVLWFTLIPEEKAFSEKSLTVPLELYNIPSNMEVVEKPIQTLDVKIRAPNRLISQITSANVHAVLDLQKARVDQEEYPLNRNMISIPEGAEVKDINPSQVTLKVEMLREITLQVEPNITGKLQEGLILVSKEVIPPQVVVKGPESKIKAKDKVSTSPIDISVLTKSSEVEADLILSNPELRLASSKTKVLVRFVIQEEGANKESAGKETKKKAKIIK